MWFRSISKMDKLIFALELCLLVAATKIDGDLISSKHTAKKSSAKSTGNSQAIEVFPPELESITPPDVLIEPIFEKRPPPPQQINGRLLTPAEGCGYSAMGAPRIIGGKPARNGAYPWVTLLGYCPVDLRNKGYGISFRCGASLITSRHVLTAAHCLFSELWFARVGEHDYRTTIDGLHQDVPIVDAQGHPDYDKAKITSDIAVLRLERDVIFNDRIRPVCLPVDIVDKRMRSFNFAQKSPFVTGWGNTKIGTYQPSPYLKHVQVTVVDTLECKRIYSKANLDNVINQQVVCAGTQHGQSSCQGDSGGPLAMPVPDGHGKFPFYQIGVVSWSVGCARYPTVYASTQYFGEWIKSKLIN